VEIISRLERRDFRDDGQSLVEVLIAITVLIAVLVPALLLVTKSTQAVYNNQFKVAAVNLANGTLEADRNQAVTGQSLMLLTPATPVTVGTEKYNVTQSASWCKPPTAAGGSWMPYTTGGASYAYGVAVKVTWNGDSVGIQVSGVLTTPMGLFISGTFPPTAATCPL
jgi:type II secretory pathway pseudopilin PulG